MSPGASLRQSCARAGHPKQAFPMKKGSMTPPKSAFPRLNMSDRMLEANLATMDPNSADAILMREVLILRGELKRRAGSASGDD